MSQKTVLIAGALGLLGRAAVEHFESLGDWEVIGISRRAPNFATKARFLSLDLTDRAACEAAAKDLKDVTHVVYAALYEKPDLIAGWRDKEQMAVNLAMLQNLLEPLEAAAPGLRHISLLQGAKAYGVHIAPAPVPTKERWPRHQHENFYWLQEDYLKEAGTEAGFTWTIFRPTVAMGPNVGVAMNVLPVIGVYAAIAHETGQPFGFPSAMPYPREAVDVKLIAEATRWAATEPAAANQHFNLTNGEVFSWKDLWPDVSDVLGVEHSEVEPFSMAEELPKHEELWQSIVDKHGLQAGPLMSLLGTRRRSQPASRRTTFGSAGSARFTMMFSRCRSPCAKRRSCNALSGCRMAANKARPSSK